ncbi:hypothetical protein ACJMK2_024417 [Sinanodonta woodiana]|uniref:Uncharacterized protein n=2 Tax=Sinanodonta woodiana TaxID=1069815 RepID=A0ABD3XF63_SINWO
MKLMDQPFNRQRMNGNRVFISFLILATGCGLYYVQGFQCHLAREPIIITGDTIPSVNFTWNCTLMSNESILSMVWLKEDICIAKVSYGTFTPCASYKGRVGLFERYGISINNISNKDSGHYSVVILLKDNHDQYEPCLPIYLPVLPEHRPVLNEATALPLLNGKQSLVCEQHGPSKLEIGLICAILPLTVVIGLGGVVWYCRRKKQNGNHMERENVSHELFPLSINI